MIVLVNLLIELMVTGLFTALFLALLAKLGMLPMVFLSFQEKDEDEKDDTPY